VTATDRDEPSPLYERVKLAGMDDAGPFDLLPLTIAAAMLPAEQMGRQAMHQLAKRLEDPTRPHTPQHIILPAEIRSREHAPGYLRLGRNPAQALS
jgi:GntR family transcriptional regulator, arabinose operon transcriptional repressor